MRRQNNFVAEREQRRIFGQWFGLEDIEPGARHLSFAYGAGEGSLVDDAARVMVLMMRTPSLMRESTAALTKLVVSRVLGT